MRNHEWLSGCTSHERRPDYAHTLLYLHHHRSPYKWKKNSFKSFSQNIRGFRGGKCCLPDKTLTKWRRSFAISTQVCPAEGLKHFPHIMCHGCRRPSATCTRLEFNLLTPYLFSVPKIWITFSGCLSRSNIAAKGPRPFSFLGATKHLYKRVCPSVRPLRLLIYPPTEVFRSTLCRVPGLVFWCDDNKN